MKRLALMARRLRRKGSHWLAVLLSLALTGSHLLLKQLNHASHPAISWPWALPSIARRQLRATPSHLRATLRATQNPCSAVFEPIEPPPWLTLWFRLARTGSEAALMPLAMAEMTPIGPPARRSSMERPELEDDLAQLDAQLAQDLPDAALAEALARLMAAADRCLALAFRSARW